MSLSDWMWRKKLILLLTIVVLTEVIMYLMTSEWFPWEW